MQNFILFLIASLAFYPLNSFSQNTRSDSLRQRLLVTPSDTDKINTLTALAWELKYENPDSAYRLTREAFTFSKKIKWEKGIANACHNFAELSRFSGNYRHALEYNFKALISRIRLNDKTAISKSLGNIGVIYMNEGNYPLALEYYHKALRIDESLNRKSGIAAKLGNIGNILKEQGKYEEALHHYFKALEIDKEVNNLTGQITKLNNIGIIYQYQGKYPEALNAYFKSLKICEGMQSEYDKAIAYCNIGLLYQEQKEMGLALNYYNKALETAERLNHKKLQSTVLGNIGLFYFQKNDNDQALEYFQKALKHDEEMDFKTGVARHLGNLGNVYFRKKEYPTALDYYLKAMYMEKELDNKRDLSLQLGYIGATYLEMKKFNLAEKPLTEALHLSEALKVPDLQRDHHSRLSNLYSDRAESILQNKAGNESHIFSEINGLYKKSTDHLLTFLTLKDSLFNNANSKDIGKIEANYEMELEKMNNVKMENEKKRIYASQVARRNLLENTAIFIFIIFLLIGLFFFSRMRFRFSVQAVKSILFFSLLILFEFLLVLLEPTLTKISGTDPILKLMLNGLIASVLIPLHGYLENLTQKKLFSVPEKVKNKPITGKLILITGLFLVSGLNIRSSFKANPGKDESLNSVSDTSEINRLIKYSQDLYDRNLDSALRVAHEAYLLSVKNNWQKGIALASDNLGVYHFLIGNKDTAEVLFKKALKIFIKTGDNEGASTVYGHLGNYYSDLGENSKSLTAYNKALEINLKTGNQSKLANTYGNFAQLYSHEGNFSQALKYYFMSLRISEKSNDKNGVAFIYTNIGLVYKIQEDFSLALDYLFKALKYFEQTGNQRGVSANLGNIGGIYWGMGKYTEALEYYFKSLAIGEKINDLNNMGTSMSDIGLIFMNQGDSLLANGDSITPYNEHYPKAMEWYMKALAISKKTGDKYGVAITKGNTALLLISLKRYPEAELFLQEALAISDSVRLLPLKAEHLKNLGELYYATGKYNKSYRQYSAYGVLKDSLFNDEKSKDLGRLEAKYEFEKEEMRIKTEEAEKLRRETDAIRRKNMLK